VSGRALPGKSMTLAGIYIKQYEIVVPEQRKSSKNLQEDMLLKEHLSSPSPTLPTSARCFLKRNRISFRIHSIFNVNTM